MPLHVLTGVRLIFTSPLFLLLAVGFAIFAFVIAALVPNLGLTWEIVSATSISPADKVNVVAALIGSIGTGSSVLSIAMTGVVAILFGANGAAIAFLFGQRRRGSGGAQAATSLTALASGMAGMGCAACGTVAIGPVLSLLGLGGSLAVLPLGGQEFTILAIALLTGSFIFAAKRAAMTPSCSIDGALGEHQCPTDVE